ncbi:MAG: endonuclease MutS2 [Clostridia bacterium]|nr:endonuclease MutS2 [Clostridia bacterium]
MILEKTLKALEFDKILFNLSNYAVLDRTKSELISFSPLSDFKEVSLLLDKTQEAYSLFYDHGISGVFYFADIADELRRVNAGGTLNNIELLRVADNLKSARNLKHGIAAINDEKIVHLRKISDSLYENYELEKEITSKIISEDEISDNASPRLYSIRKNIRDINARIREKLNSYMRAGANKYLQDAVVTMRQDRYVIPVKSEFRSQIKGFIHDQSSSGATVFIEPEQVMELNNDLKRATFEEREEIYKILAELSSKVVLCSNGLTENAVALTEIDGFFARAEYAFKTKSIRPELNNQGIIDIKKGRHPLIDAEKVVPISLHLGEKFNFLLLTGPNTGGKTVSLKLVGLFSLMAMSGMFIPAGLDSRVSVFDGVYSDIGDEQSIEQSLSTFSSHIKNLIDILNVVQGKNLVLLDEIGAGTDPEEGSAIALAIIDKLLESDCYGIITTHYSKLKEYAMTTDKIENASMEFDAATLKPVYKINIGIPGSSNAIEIAKTLGLSQEVINGAFRYLSDKSIGFEEVLKKAEQSRREYDRLSAELATNLAEKDKELKDITAEKEKIKAERERIYFTARQETKRIVADKLSEAEEIIVELKKILKAANLESKEIIRASELKNRIQNSRYLDFESENAPIELIKAGENDVKTGKTVYVKSLDAYARIVSINKNKGEAEILIGDIKSKIKISDIYNPEDAEKSEKTVKIVNKARGVSPKKEINVIGKSSLEAIDEVKAFIDQAVVNGLEEIKIVHGVGAGILLKAIREYLKQDKNVKDFRRGLYGEGENGVTIVHLK